MAVSLMIMVLGLGLLLYAIYQVRKISGVLLEAQSRRTLVNVVILFFLLMSTYFGFSILFAFDFDFNNTNAVMSLLLFLSALYIAIFTNLAVVVRDISIAKIERLREANRRLTDVSKNKDEFVKVTAHELRIPLMMIRDSVQELQKPGLTTARQKEHLGVITKGVQRLDTEVFDMGELAHLDFSAITFTPLWVRPSEVLKSLKDQLELIAERKKLKTSFRVSGSDDVFKTDMLRLNQVLAKLFVNAMRHSPEGGTIIVACDRNPQRVEFTVTDEGPAIPKDHLPHVFETSYIEHVEKGEAARSGLVLAICKKLVEVMGGKIGVESADGRGTSFYFLLPVKIGSKPKNNR